MGAHIPSDYIVGSIAFLVIGIFALLGNGMVLFTIYKHPSLQNSFNVFVTSLALANILNAGFCLPLTTIGIVSTSLINSRIICFIRTDAAIVTAAVSMASLALMTVNRYYLVVKPSRFPQIFGIKKTFAIAGFSCFISIVFATATLAFMIPRYKYNITILSVHCLQLKSDPVVAVFLYLFVFVIPPGVIVVIFYFKSYQFIYKPRGSVLPESRTPNLQLYVKEAKTLRVLLILLVSHYCCLIPMIFLRLAEKILSECPLYFPVLGKLLQYLINIVIPVIYAFVSNHFRKEIQNIVVCNVLVS